MKYHGSFALQSCHDSSTHQPWYMLAPVLSNSHDRLQSSHINQASVSRSGVICVHDGHNDSVDQTRIWNSRTFGRVQLDSKTEDAGSFLLYLCRLPFYKSGGFAALCQEITGASKNAHSSSVTLQLRECAAQVLDYLARADATMAIDLETADEDLPDLASYYAEVKFKHFSLTV